MGCHVVRRIVHSRPSTLRDERAVKMQLREEAAV